MRPLWQSLRRRITWPVLWQLLQAKSLPRTQAIRERAHVNGITDLCAVRCSIRWGVAWALPFGGMQAGGLSGTEAKTNGDTMTEQKIFIVDRPMYRVIVIVDGLDVDVQIVLTSKGKRYARGRARGFHHVIQNDEDALAEIIHARDNYYPAAQRPDRMLEAKF